MSYVSSKYAEQYYGISAATLRNWSRDGLIEFKTTPKGHRRYKIHTEKREKPRKFYIYCRVSSKKQEDDLQRQVEYMQSKYPGYEVKTDIGSGINGKRPGFLSILEQLFEGNINEVRVASMDRWSRFGNDTFRWMFDRYGARLISEKEQSVRSKSEELADDLMEVITVFSAKYHGMRKYENHQDKDQAEYKPEETV